MKEVINELNAILNESEDRKNLISKFQYEVWHGHGYHWENECVLEVLSDLAFDLDYYEPNSAALKESSSFYTDEGLKREILEAIERIEACHAAKFL